MKRGLRILCFFLTGLFIPLTVWAGIEIDISESSFWIDGPRKMTIENLVVGQNSYWASFQWDSTSTKWYVVDFGVSTIKKPTWHQKIPGYSRFQVVLDEQAVLDRETGLVWERGPSTDKRAWIDACGHCYKKEVAGRKGWRLPTIEELGSLVDTSSYNPTLPGGHPFYNIMSGDYWSCSTVQGTTASAWIVDFLNGEIEKPAKTYFYNVWCVRGGYGHDAQ